MEAKREYETTLPILGEKVKVIEGDNFCMLIPLEPCKEHIKPIDYGNREWDTDTEKVVFYTNKP